MKLLVQPQAGFWDVIEVPESCHTLFEGMDKEGGNPITWDATTMARVFFGKSSLFQNKEQRKFLKDLPVLINPGEGKLSLDGQKLRGFSIDNYPGRLVDLSNGEYTRRSRLRRTGPLSINMSRLKLSSLSIEMCNLSGRWKELEAQLGVSASQLDDLRVRDSILSYSTVTRVRFGLYDLADCNLSGTTFRQCLFSYGKMVSNNLGNTVFKKCTFRGAVFASNDMLDALFEDCSFHSTTFIRSIEYADPVFKRCSWVDGDRSHLDRDCERFFSWGYLP